jgi:hypothetical protein
MNISQSLNIRVHKNKTIQYALHLLFFHLMPVVDMLIDYIILLSTFYLLSLKAGHSK